MSPRSQSCLLFACALLPLSCEQPGFAQSAQPAIFVANNGNAEGSVTSFMVNSDGTLTFVQKVVTPGSTNAQCIDISPNGRWLCTGHGTINGVTEQLTFFEVHSDATISIALETTTPDSPVDVVWLDDEHLVVTNTSATPNDQLIVYRFNQAPRSITQTWFHTLGSSTFDLAIDREHDLLFARASTSAVLPLRINPAGTLTSLAAQPTPTGVFFLGPGLSPDGTRLYYGGGISSSGGLSSRWIGGLDVDTTTGALTPMPNSPYLSPPADGTSGPSPKQVVVSRDGQFAFVAHGTTAHIAGFSIGADSTLTPIANSYFDVGGQGDSGNMATMGDHVFVTRRYAGTGGNPPAGAISLTINADGTLTPAGTTVPTQGSLPWDIAVWPGIPADCPADVNGSAAVDVDDLLAIISAWGPCPAPPAKCPANVINSGTSADRVDVDDLLAVISAWGRCP